MNHTQSVFCNSVLAAPPDVSFEECTPLAVRNMVYTDGTPSITSFWRPTESELRMLNAGGLVSLEMLTQAHPMVVLGVVGK